MCYTQYHMYSDKLFNIYYNTNFISCVHHLIHFIPIPCGGENCGEGKFSLSVFRGDHVLKERMDFSKLI